MHKKKFKVSIVASGDDESLPAYEIEVFPEGAEEPEIQQHTVVDVTAKFLQKLKDNRENSCHLVHLLETVGNG